MSFFERKYHIQRDEDELVGVDGKDHRGADHPQQHQDEELGNVQMSVFNADGNEVFEQHQDGEDQPQAPQANNQQVVNLEEEEEEQPQSQRRSLCNRSKIVARLCWQHFRADWRTNLGYLIFTGLVFAWMIHEGSPFIVMLMGLVIFFCLSSCIRLCLLAHDEEEGARFRMQLQQNPQPLMMINPLHLRLALVDRDFTPNDYDALLRLDDGNRGAERQRLSRNEIELLPVHRVSEAEISKSPANCAVCLDAIQAGDQLRTLTCLHRFHVACIDPWLRTNAICPVCNMRVVVGN